MVVGVAFFALLLLWPERDLAQECLDRIQLGKHIAEVEPILKEYGFRFVELDAEADVYVKYERKTEGVALCLTFNHRDGVTSKKLQRSKARHPVNQLWWRLARWWGRGG
jgi:hypothetical protein